MSHDADDEPHEEHEEHVNHEAWVIPYADLLTLLMAMFIALFAMSSVDQAKFKKVALGFNDALGGEKLTSGVFAGSKADSVNGGNGKGGSSNDLQEGKERGTEFFEKIADQQVALEQRKNAEQDTLEEVKDLIEGEAAKAGLSDKLTFELQERGLVVRVLTDKLVFRSGDATLQAQGRELLQLVGAVLKDLENPLYIEGHTDTDPVGPNSVFKSNWGLSTARAEEVLLFLRDVSGIDQGRLRPTGWSDTHPIASNDTEAGKATNRRVEIVVQSLIIDQLLAENDLGTKSLPKSDPAKPNLDEIEKPGDIAPH